MMGNDEIRALAWTRLWKRGWFARLFGGGILLGVCASAINSVIGSLLKAIGVDDWECYLQALVANRVNPSAFIPQLTQDYIVRATSATCLRLFIAYIMAGIVAYGVATILLKCVRDEEPNWLGDAFGGFKAPFAMAGLYLRYMLVFLAWTLLPVLAMAAACALAAPFAKTFYSSSPEVAVPVAACAALLAVCALVACASVPFYRYRFLFLVKAEHPDWTVGECFRECRALMKGNVWRSVKLDFSYWRPIAAVFFAVAASTFAISAGADSSAGSITLGFAAVIAISVLVLIASIPAAIVLGYYIGVGQGLLYRELTGAASEASGLSA